MEDILMKISAFEPTNDNWLELEDLLSALWETPEPVRGINELFGILERFPEEDGAGVLWSIVHGVEQFPDYEQHLLESMQRQPSHIGLIMVSRMLATGATHIRNQPIAAMVADVLAHKKTTATLRREALEIKRRLLQP